jgi:hypothetical protein
MALKGILAELDQEIARLQRRIPCSFPRQALSRQRNVEVGPREAPRRLPEIKRPKRNGTYRREVARTSRKRSSAAGLPKRRNSFVTYWCNQSSTARCCTVRWQRLLNFVKLCAAGSQKRPRLNAILQRQIRSTYSTSPVKRILQFLPRCIL